MEHRGKAALERIQAGLDCNHDGYLAIQYLAERVEQLERTLGERNQKFSPPVPAEVTEYGTSIGFPVDGAYFCAYYEARGWMIGKTKMRSWKAAVRTWKARRVEETMAKRKSESDTIPIRN